ncbi:uncharacterized protein LOC132263451 [Phlebotomus argentipes]|uniref:uncharacterized protein LOC132263451 n=1 Tax=Phlebotomus argentipes TaxID=94469 RepID=UPI0028936210|nr:uncharacterized protein LOC132263451 [Phlebotomus argentipes]
MKWSRSESIPFPQIWWRFPAKDPESGEIVEYRIEDCSEDRFDEIVDLMVNCFTPDEPISASLGIMKDKESLSEMKEKWVEILPQKLTLVCYKEGTSELCGFNVLEINEEIESQIVKEENKGRGVKDIRAVFNFLKEKGDVYRRYNVDKYLHGRGLFIVPKYRGCGIATELLKARIPLMKALGLTLTCTVFSAPGSQAAAKKAGFTEDVVVTYDSLGKEYPFVQIPNIPFRVVKFMCLQLKK